MLAAASQPAAWAAGNCYSPSAIEAEEAIRFLTDVMVVSSACQDTIYAQFRLRNQTAIVAYQKAMITHFHGAKAFDSWNTSLANKSSQKHAGLPTAQICQQAAEMMRTATSLDTKGFRQYAANQAKTVGANYPKCGK